jgi:hypothetical protein
MNSAAKVRKNILAAEFLEKKMPKRNNFLQIHLTADTQHAVGTGKRVTDERRL